MPNKFLAFGLFLITLYGVSACRETPKSTLRFHLVYEDTNGEIVTDLFRAKNMPDGLAYYMGTKGDGVFVELPAVMDETCLTKVEAGHDYRKRKSDRKNVLFYTMTKACAKRYFDYNVQNKGRYTAVVLNGNILEIHQIKTTVLTDIDIISGDFGPWSDLEDLANSFQLD